MEYSSCAHEEEQRLELNSCPLENVTKNEESMTGIEVENWTQNKKSHLTDHVKGEFSTIKTEVENLKNSEDDRKNSTTDLLEPQKLFGTNCKKWH